MIRLEIDVVIDCDACSACISVKAPVRASRRGKLLIDFDKLVLPEGWVISRGDKREPFCPTHAHRADYNY